MIEGGASLFDSDGVIGKDIFCGIRARPLVAVAVLYLVGTLYGLSGFESHVWIAVGVAFCTAFTAVGALGMERGVRLRFCLTRVVLYVAVSVAAGTLACSRCRPPDPGHGIGRGLLAAEESGESVALEGAVVSDPDVTFDRDRGYETARFALRVRSFEGVDGATLETDHRIDVCLRGVRSPHPRYGESWSVRGRILRSEWGRFRARRYVLAWQGQCRRTGTGGGLAFLRKCYAVRRWAAERLALGIAEHHEAVAMMQALLLGYRSRVDSGIRETFAETGAVHVFAISGLHVGIVAIMIIVLLRLMRVSRERWVLVLAPLLICYTATTGMRASAVRACLMGIVYYLGPLLGRKSDGFSALSFAALVILVVAPGQALDIGFIFSFTVVLGLISLYRICYWPFRGLTHADELRLQPEGGLKVLGRKAVSYAVSLFALSAAAWLTSAPLTAYVFGRFSLAALLSNFAVVPVTAAVVTCGFLSLIAGSCFEFLGVLLNHVNLVCVSALMLFVRVVASLPFACIHVRDVPVWVVFVWYAVLCGAAFWLNARIAARRPRGQMGTDVTVPDL